jgi:hypothetical protein
MKDINKVPLSKIMPELKQIAEYHGLKINRAKDFKTTLFIFKNLYYNAPWESEETSDYEETKPIYGQGLILVTKRKPRRAFSILQKLKRITLRRIFKKFGL